MKMTTQELEDVIHDLGMIGYMRGLRGDERAERESIPRVTWTDGEDTYTCEYIVTDGRARTICMKNGWRSNFDAVSFSFDRLLMTLRKRLEEEGAI